MSTQVNLYEAKTRLSDLVERAAAGEDIVIAKNGRPRARLVAVPDRTAPRVFGRWRAAEVFRDGWEDDLTEHFDEQ
ncbi:type II toxin-antitoxin system Phd/YefM family antitoxin [Aquipuribacter sp. SD81]|uniref:type II toxin-antitoxin system Phd/YefM family antitoxin n=1 Tax=Aquipuribacter sp. SD81 TaxID=3127703 RepID=UPI00301890B7